MKPKLRSKFAVTSNEELAKRLGGSHFLPAFLGGTRPDFSLQDLWQTFPEIGDVDLAAASKLDAIDL